MDQIEKSKQTESQTILQFLRENVTQWKTKMQEYGLDDRYGENSKRNLFSQNDSEAQFIEQEPLDDDDDDFDEEDFEY